MTCQRTLAAVVSGGATIGLLAAPAGAEAMDEFTATLKGLEEVPSISSAATGSFEATVMADGSIAYELGYAGLESAVTQAHIHFGMGRTNGGVSVFLCSNLGTGPTGTQPCPETEGMVSGTIAAGDVIGPADQGIAAGELEELVDAMAARATYVNVHTTGHPAGEIRGNVVKAPRPKS